MSGIKRFEDIEAWREARQLVRDVYEISSVGIFAKDFGLRDQIRRAAVSVMSNIVKASSVVVTRSFRNFCLWRKLLVERSGRNCTWLWIKNT